MTHDELVERMAAAAVAVYNANCVDGSGHDVSPVDLEAMQAALEASTIEQMREEIAGLRATKKLDHMMLGRFVAQYEEGADGFFVDADDAQEVALQVKAALALGKTIMDEIDRDTSIPTEVCCKVFAAIKRAHAAALPPIAETKE